MMMEAGMDIAKLKFPHGSYDYHKKTVENIKKAATNYSNKIGMYFAYSIALDIKDPEFRQAC